MAALGRSNSLSIRSKMPAEARKAKDPRSGPDQSAGPATPSRSHQNFSTTIPVVSAENPSAYSRKDAWDHMPRKTGALEQGAEDAQSRLIHEIQHSANFFRTFLRLFDADTALVVEYADAFDARILGDLWMAKIRWQDKQAKWMQQSGQMNSVPKDGGGQRQGQALATVRESFKSVAKGLHEALSTASMSYTMQHSGH